MFGNADWAHKAVEEIDAKYKAVRAEDKRRLDEIRELDRRAVDEAAKARTLMPQTEVPK